MPKSIFSKDIAIYTMCERAYSHLQKETNVCVIIEICQDMLNVFFTM